MYTLSVDYQKSKNEKTNRPNGGRGRKNQNLGPCIKLNQKCMVKSSGTCQFIKNIKGSSDNIFVAKFMPEFKERVSAAWWICIQIVQSVLRVALTGINYAFFLFFVVVENF